MKHYVFILFIFFQPLYTADDVDAEHMFVANGGRQAIIEFLRSLGLAMTPDELRQQVYDVLDLNGFEFDANEGRTPGDMLNGMLIRLKHVHIEIVKQQKILDHCVQKEQLKELIACALDDRLSQLEARVNTLERIYSVQQQQLQGLEIKKDRVSD